jgi:hypothetical protein
MTVNGLKTFKPLEKYAIRQSRAVMIVADLTAQVRLARVFRSTRGTGVFQRTGPAQVWFLERLAIHRSQWIS